MGFFKSRATPRTAQQLQLIGKLDAAYDELERDLYGLEGFIQTFVEKINQISSQTPQPILDWTVLDQVCEKCKMELVLLLSITHSCGHLMMHTGHLRMQGFMKEAQALAVKLDELSTALQANISDKLNPLLPADKREDAGFLGFYYCDEVINAEIDFTKSMREKYGVLDSQIVEHFGLHS